MSDDAAPEIDDQAGAWIATEMDALVDRFNAFMVEHDPVIAQAPEPARRAVASLTLGVVMLERAAAIAPPHVAATVNYFLTGLNAAMSVQIAAAQAEREKAS